MMRFALVFLKRYAISTDYLQKVEVVRDWVGLDWRALAARAAPTASEGSARTVAHTLVIHVSSLISVLGVSVVASDNPTLLVAMYVVRFPDTVMADVLGRCDIG